MSRYRWRTRVSGSERPFPLVRQRVQALAVHAPLDGDERQLALAAAPDGSADFDQVTEIELGSELRQLLAADVVLIDQNLDVAGPVAHVREHHSAVVADPQEASRDSHAGALR